MKIIAVHEHPHLVEGAVQFFWEQWGNEQNFRFYEDCMIHSGKSGDGIPRFYVGIENEEIIGTYALIRNDLNSRQDFIRGWHVCTLIPAAGERSLAPGCLIMLLKKRRSLDLRSSISRRICKGIMKNTAGHIAERCTGRAGIPLSYMKRILAHLRAGTTKTKRPGIS